MERYLVLAFVIVLLPFLVIIAPYQTETTIALAWFASGAAILAGVMNERSNHHW